MFDLWGKQRKRGDSKPSKFRELLSQVLSYYQQRFSESQTSPVQVMVLNDIHCYFSDWTDATLSQSYSDYGKRGRIEAIIYSELAIW